MSLWEAGDPHSLTACGIGVYGTTGRLEKAYRAYGAELETEYNVVEAGMQRPSGEGAGVRRQGGASAPPRGGAGSGPLHAHGRRPHLWLRASKRYPLGREPITLRDGTPLTDAKGRRSYVTSAGAGPSLGKYILLAYLPPAAGRSSASDALAVRALHERALPGRSLDAVATTARTPGIQGWR